MPRVDDVGSHRGPVTTALQDVEVSYYITIEMSLTLTMYYAFSDCLCETKLTSSVSCPVRFIVYDVSTTMPSSALSSGDILLVLSDDPDVAIRTSFEV